MYETKRSVQPIPLGGTGALVTGPSRRTKQPQCVANGVLLSPGKTGFLSKKNSTNVKRSLTRTLSSRAQQLKREARLRERKGGTEKAQWKKIRTTSNQRTSSSNRRSSETDVTNGVTSLNTVLISCPCDDKQEKRDHLWAYQNNYRRAVVCTIDAVTPVHRRLSQREKNGQRTRSKSTPGVKSVVAYPGNSSYHKSRDNAELKSPPQNDVVIKGGNNLKVRVPSPGPMRAASAKMPYRLQPLGTGYYSSSSSHGDWVATSDCSNMENTDEPSPRNTVDESVKLPSITSHCSLSQDMMNTSSLLGGQFQQRPFPGLFPIKSRGFVTQLNSGDPICNDIREINGEMGSMYTSRIPWDSGNCESKYQSPEKHADSDIDENALDTDCSEDGHSGNYQASDEDEDTEDEASQNMRSVPKLPLINSANVVVGIVETWATDAGKPEGDISIQSIDFERFSGRANRIERRTINAVSLDEDNSTSSNRSMEYAKREGQLPDIHCRNSTLGKADLEGVSGGGMGKENCTGEYNITEEEKDQNEIGKTEAEKNCAVINVKDPDNRVISEIPLEPCRRARTYKRRSYRLHDLTAGFRNEMYKNHKLIQVSDHDDDRIWFEDMVRSGQVVDDTAYDSFARRSFTKIKNTKQSISKVYENKPPELVLLPTPKQAETPPPVQPTKDHKLDNVSGENISENTQTKKVTCPKTKPKHAKLKLALSQWRE